MLLHRLLLTPSHYCCVSSDRVSSIVRGTFDRRFVACKRVERALLPARGRVRVSVSAPILFGCADFVNTVVPLLCGSHVARTLTHLSLRGCVRMCVCVCVQVFCVLCARPSTRSLSLQVCSAVARGLPRHPPCCHRAHQP